MIYEILFEMLIFTPITIQYSFTKTRKLGRIDHVNVCADIMLSNCKRTTCKIVLRLGKIIISGICVVVL